jgi:hypothetical protein
VSRPSAPRTLRRLLLATLVALGLGGLALVAAGPTLLRVVEPREGTVVGAAGVEVMVEYPHAERVAPETLRVLLNGADMTEELTTAGNGAYGRLHTVLDGENVLRFEVFGRRWWLPGVLLEEAQEVRFLVRQPQDLDRG